MQPEKHVFRLLLGYLFVHLHKILTCQHVEHICPQKLNSNKGQNLYKWIYYQQISLQIHLSTYQRILQNVLAISYSHSQGVLTHKEFFIYIYIYIYTWS